MAGRERPKAEALGYLEATAKAGVCAGWEGHTAGLKRVLKKSIVAWRDSLSG